MKNISAIVLAAGLGKRLNSKTENKVLLKLSGKPLIEYTIDLLDKLKIKNKVVVVGFARESVIKSLGKRVSFAIQERLDGTADATRVGLEKLPKPIKETLVMYADHSFFYSPQMIKGLIKFKAKTKYPAVLITVDRNDPFNYGRIIKNGKNTVSEIVEEKNATLAQKKIHEINTGFYLFDCAFLKKYLPKIKRNPVTNEYYLTDIVELAVKNGVKIGAFKVYDERVSVGVNTKEQLLEAQRLMKSHAN